MIKDIYNNKKTVFSLEVFPPKKDNDISLIYKILDDLKKLSPDFISITYGAGGGTSKRTLEIASYIKNICNLEALPHLTSVSLDECLLNKFILDLNENHINNVLALRGDRPKDMSDEAYNNRSYKYASDIVSIIRNQSNICIGGACYPEIHPESLNQNEDLYYLKSKVDAGIDFLITQMFFDNAKFYRFYEQARKLGISVPISAGIMPITSATQIHTILELSSASIPSDLKSLFSKYEDNPIDFKKAGLEYAVNQISDLVNNGVQGIHLYSLNKVDVSTDILKNFTV